jgi:uroporphyrin-III C-methyltransferase/precorrin-2 dehydrogenase/sirohydrochlorin ferrochelatase
MADATPAMRVPQGFVSLVGAGPGDPDLLTRRALQRLETAEIVFYDGLVPADVVDLATGARRISVARRCGPKAITQADVNRLLIDSAREGLRVVRLKCGDPLVFARGGEEADALERAGVPFEIVPGLTTAIAAPALAGIPLTERGVASVIVVVSGHDGATFASAIAGLTPAAVTLVILMGIARRRDIGVELRQRGWPAATPTAIITNASQRSQRIWRGPLDALGGRGNAVAGAPGVIVIGDVTRRPHVS